MSYEGHLLAACGSEHMRGFACRRLPPAEDTQLQQAPVIVTNETEPSQVKKFNGTTYNTVCLFVSQVKKADGTTQHSLLVTLRHLSKEVQRRAEEVIK